MRRYIGFFVVALAILLQVNLLPALQPFGVVPNLALVAVVLVAVYLAISEALLAGAVGGLVLDLASGANFGLWTGVLILMCLVVGVVHRAGIELDRAWVAAALVVAGTLVIAAVVWLGLAAKGAQGPAGSLAGRLWMELVINLVLVMGLRPAVRRLLAGGRPRHETGG